VTIDLPALAGATSTTMFMIGALPMLGKAFRTKDMASYSLGHLLLMNAGNAMYAVYVFSLPPGPVWVLHGFWLVVTALMLGWYLRYERYRPAEANPEHRPVAPRLATA
jgi:hypothetical protein